MDAKEFHRQLDAFYEAGDISGAYRFLHEQEAAARQRGDAAMSLTVSNALIGHCRENCIFDELEGHYEEALRCLDVLEMRGSLEEAATLLNAATGFCVMGRIEESEQLFEAAEALYLALLPPGDLTLAAVYNNHGLLYRARNERKTALASFRKALAILEAGNGAPDELASSRLNLASVCDDLSEAEQAVELAAAYYETPDGQTDIHRFTALALQAEMAFRRGDYGKAGARFETIAEEWRRYGGAEQRRGVLLRNARYSYEKAGDEEALARIDALLAEVGK
jgi:tetratricopeptide (TPR) repeat protein